MSLFLEGLGWVGAVMLLAAYGLLSMKKLAATSYAYQLTNIIGSALLAVYSVWKTAGAEVLINVIWMCIGLSAVVMMLRARAKN